MTNTDSKAVLRGWCLALALAAVSGLLAIIVLISSVPQYHTTSPRALRLHAADPADSPALAVCGPACLHMAREYLGLRSDFSDLGRHADPLEPYTMLELHDMAIRVGLSATGMQLTPRELASQLVPHRTAAIIHVRERHFVLAVATASPGILAIADPRTGHTLTLPYTSLPDTLAWSGATLLLSL
jgi:ABC-type bacteriocin/lantibiotic exporter with double-glycine peptidase domain